MSGGEQQMLAVARALMSRPRLLLCDEPSLGLAPLVVRSVFDVLRQINADDGTAMLIVEQNAELALDLASRVYLLEVGQRGQLGRRRRATATATPSAAPTWGTDGDSSSTGCSTGISNGAIYAGAGAGAGHGLPGDRHDQLRPGRDGAVLHVPGLGPDRRKHSRSSVALLAAAAAGFALGAVSERALVRPIEKRGLLATLIVLLGLFSVLNAADGLIWGRGNLSMPSMFPNTLQSYVSVFGARLYWANIGVWLLVAAVVALMFGLFNGTRLGLQMRATANNRESAALAGIPVGRILMLGWGISAAIGAVAGVLFTPLTPDSLSLGEMFPLLIYASAAALFGGLDSPGGAVVAGLLLGIVEVMLPAYVPAIGGQLQEAIAFVAIVAVLLLRPQGLFGSKEVERV